jgi:hypothetical protein
MGKMTENMHYEEVRRFLLGVFLSQQEWNKIDIYGTTSMVLISGCGMAGLGLWPRHS